jgi:hypothetical protein
MDVKERYSEELYEPKTRCRLGAFYNLVICRRRMQLTRVRHGEGLLRKECVKHLVWSFVWYLVAISVISLS